MKVAAKVLIIIGMIVGFWMILPIIFGAITLKKLGNGTLTTGWKVVCLIFVSLLGGIFLLCSKDTDYALNAPQADPYAQQNYYAQPQQQAYAQPQQDPYAQQQAPAQDPYAQPQQIPAQDPYAQQNYYAQPQQQAYAQPQQDPYAQQQAPAQDPYAQQQAPQQNYYNQQ